MSRSRRGFSSQPADKKIKLIVKGMKDATTGQKVKDLKLQREDLPNTVLAGHLYFDCNSMFLQASPVISDFGDLSGACMEINRKFSPELDGTAVPFTPFSLPAPSRPSSPRRKQQSGNKRGRDARDADLGGRPAETDMQTEDNREPKEVHIADGDTSESERMEDEDELTTETTASPV